MVAKDFFVHQQRVGISSRAKQLADFAETGRCWNMFGFSVLF